jgi:hypothetical protein
MSREIKFKTWHPETSRMSDKSYSWEMIMRFGFKEFVPLQYTGFKDRNGVEIYDGHILRHDIGLGPLYYVVYWCSADGQWKIDKEHGGNTGPWFDYYEVVGNTFEHSELLKII